MLSAIMSMICALSSSTRDDSLNSLLTLSIGNTALPGVVRAAGVFVSAVDAAKIPLAAFSATSFYKLAYGGLTAMLVYAERPTRGPPPHPQA